MSDFSVRLYVPVRFAAAEASPCDPAALCNIPPEQFSLWEWQDAVAYITEETLSFESQQRAADYLKNYRVRQETGGSYET